MKADTLETKTRYINLPTGRIAYLRTGGDLPPLVLAHGLTDSARCWTRTAHVLRDKFDVIMLDARGHGHSERISQSNGAGPGEDIADAIRVLELGNPVVAGHSVGASAVASLANQYPKLTSKVILEDPPFGPLKTESEKATQVEAFQAQVRNLSAMSFDEVLAQGRKINSVWHVEELIPWAKSKHQVDEKVVEHLQFAPWQQLIDQIESPTLLIYGERTLGGIVTPEVAEEAQLINKQIKPVQIKGAGHNIHREKFDNFISAAMDFL